MRGNVTETAETTSAATRLTEVAIACTRAGGVTALGELARLAARSTGAAYALLSAVQDERAGRLLGRALVRGGELREIGEFAAVDAPCGAVLDEGCAARAATDGQFTHPALGDDTPLRAYYGITVRDAQQRILGVLAVMDDETLRDDELRSPILNIIAARAAVVLQEVSAPGEDEVYRLMFNASLDGLCLINASGVVVDHNPALSALDGFSRDEIIGRFPPRFRDPATHGDHLRTIRRVLAGERLRQQVQLPHRDGSTRPVEMRHVRIVVRGEPHVLVVIHDLSERRRYEGELRRSEDLYRALFEASLDGMAVLSADGKVVDVNPALTRSEGFTREELVGQMPPAFRTEALQAVHRAFVAKVLKEGTFNSVTELVRGDGSCYMADTRSVRIEYRNEPHVLVVVRDISEQRRRESELASSEERYRAVFEGVIDGLALIRKDGIVVDVNQAMLDLDGFDREELVGKLPPTYIGDDEKIAQHREYVRRVLADEHVKREFYFERKDGSHYFAEVRAIRINHNNEPHVLLLIRDITEQKRSAEQSAVLEAQLRQAQKMEAIGHLTGGVAHDFNNILTSILGYVALAKNYVGPGGDARLERYLERAERAGARARDLISQMLTFSRGQQGERRDVNASYLVRETVNMLESSFPATTEICMSLPDEAPVINIDPVHFEQILMNLCINARDAMEGIGSIDISLQIRNGVHFTCSGCHEPVSGRYVELSVSDSGPGIEQAIIERIFEPFFTTKEVGKGSGMGLSMVHGIVHDNEGHTYVSSAVGSGTTMRILFPARSGVPTPRECASAEVAKRAVAALSGRVLLVDDNAEVSEYLEDLLTSWGLAVTVLDDPREACARLAAAPGEFDLVITDQTMPRMSGLELTRQIVALETGPPVVLYTGYSESVSEESALEAGARAFLHKPLDTAQLNELLRDVLC